MTDARALGRPWVAGRGGHGALCGGIRAEELFHFTEKQVVGAASGDKPAFTLSIVVDVESSRTRRRRAL
jgi:hypothetical protein